MAQINEAWSFTKTHLDLAQLATNSPLFSVFFTGKSQDREALWSLVGGIRRAVNVRGLNRPPNIVCGTDFEIFRNKFPLVEKKIAKICVRHAITRISDVQAYGAIFVCKGFFEKPQIAPYPASQVGQCPPILLNVFPRDGAFQTSRSTNLLFALIKLYAGMVKQIGSADLHAYLNLNPTVWNRFHPDFINYSCYLFSMNLFFSNLCFV